MRSPRSRFGLVFRGVMRNSLVTALAPPRRVFFPRPSDVGRADTPCFLLFPARQASPTLGPNGSKDVPWGLTQNDIASFVGWSQSLISQGF